MSFELPGAAAPDAAGLGATREASAFTPRHAWLLPGRAGVASATGDNGCAVPSDARNDLVSSTALCAHCKVSGDARSLRRDCCGLSTVNKPFKVAHKMVAQTGSQDSDPQKLQIRVSAAQDVSSMLD